MSKELTKKWENGHLKSGYYYIKYKNGQIGIDRYNFKIYDSFTLRGFSYADCDIEEILAEVPTCEEFQNLKEYERIVKSYSMKPINYDMACSTVYRLLDENKALKQKLKLEKKYRLPMIELYYICKLLRSTLTTLTWQKENCLKDKLPPIHLMPRIIGTQNALKKITEYIDYRKGSKR